MQPVRQNIGFMNVNISSISDNFKEEEWFNLQYHLNYAFAHQLDANFLLTKNLKLDFLPYNFN